MKISPISRNPINRPQYSFATGSVQPTESTSPAHKILGTDSQTASENAQLSYENYQDKLNEQVQKTKKEKFEEEKDSSKRKNNYTKEEKETLESLTALLNKFNISIDAIKKTDLAKNQNNLGKIRSSFEKNSRFLSKIGITMDKLSHFKLDPSIFTKEVIKDPSSLSHLFDPQTGVLKEIIASFHGMLI